MALERPLNLINKHLGLVSFRNRSS
jgi:PilZ domain